MTRTPILATAKTPAAEPYHLITPSQLKQLPPVQWRIKGVLPAQGLAVVYGASGSGKSFLVMDACAAIAEGSETWFNHRIVQAGVVYICLESESGLAQRVAAWEVRHKRAMSEEFRIVRKQPFRLTSPGDIIRMVDAAAELGFAPVLVIDTLNRAAPDADENSSLDMNVLIEATSQLQQRTKGLIVLVHHQGKDATKGMRGHSSLHAAIDAAIEVNRETTGSRRNWHIAKQKDGADDVGSSFFLDIVELGEDDDGDPISSCVVRPDALTLGRMPAPRKLGPHQAIALEVVTDLLKQANHWGESGAPITQPCIQWEDAITAVGNHLPVEQDRRRERAKSAISKLIHGSHLGHNEGWIWLK